MIHSLPKLSYSFEALEPYIDQKQWKFTTVSIIVLM